MPRTFVLLCLLSVSHAAEVSDEVVGGLDLDRLAVVISDGPTFPPDQVAEAVRKDPLLEPAAHFFAPRKELLRLIAERCATGYRSHGFPAPRVSATVQGRGAGGRLVVAVTEGVRLRWGTVRVSDAGPVGEEAVRQRLCAPWRAPDAKPDDEPEDPLIVSGEPARFDDLWNRTLVRAIADFYAGEGFQDCSPVVRTGEPRDGQVDCLISFSAPPRALLINRVSVIGAKRNTPETVTTWLADNAKLTVDGPATRAVMNRARQALTDSGRFLTTALTTTKTPDRPHHVDVVVTVTESERLPLLDQPLGDLRQDGLRWRERMLREIADGSVTLHARMVLADHPLRFEALLNAQHGCLVRFTSLDPGMPLDATLGVAGRRLFYRSHTHNRNASIAWDAAPVFTLKLDTIAGEQPHNFTFNIAFESAAEKPLTEIAISPSFVLSQLSDAERHGTRLVSTGKKTIATIDLEGDLPFMVSTVADASDTFHLTRKAWTDLVPTVTGTTTGDILMGQPDSVSAIIGLLGEDLLPLATRQTGVDEAAARMWLSALIATGTAWWPGTPEDDQAGTVFRIPVELPPEQMIGQFVTFLRRMILDHTRDLWPDTAWPVLILNEASAVVNGNTTHTRAMLAHLVDGKTMGPLGHGVLAMLMGFVDPRTARVIAGLGRDHLTVESWADDVTTLMPTLPPVRTALSSFSDPAVAARALPEAHRATFIDLVQRAKDDLTPEQERALLRDGARLLWHAGAEWWLPAWLDDLAREPAATGGLPP